MCFIDEPNITNQFLKIMLPTTKLHSIILLCFNSVTVKLNEQFVYVTTVSCNGLTMTVCKVRIITRHKYYRNKHYFTKKCS